MILCLGNNLLKFNVGSELLRLSSFMEGRDFHLSPTTKNDVREILPSKWDSTSSVLYALSILVCFKQHTYTLFLRLQPAMDLLVL